MLRRRRRRRALPPLPLLPLLRLRLLRRLAPPAACAPWPGRGEPLRRASRRPKTPRPFLLRRLAGWPSLGEGWRKRGASAAEEVGEEEEEEESEEKKKSRVRRQARRRRRTMRKTPPRAEASSFLGNWIAAKPLIVTTRTHPEEQQKSIRGTPRLLLLLLGRAGQGRLFAALKVCSSKKVLRIRLRIGRCWTWPAARAYQRETTLQRRG